MVSRLSSAVKKVYIQPIVEQSQLIPSSVVLAGNNGIGWSGEELSDESDDITIKGSFPAAFDVFIS